MEEPTKYLIFDATGHIDEDEARPLRDIYEDLKYHFEQADKAPKIGVRPIEDNFCFSVSLPEEKEARLAAIANLRWLLRVFLGTLSGAYVPDSTRREQANDMVVNLLGEMQHRLTTAEYEALSSDIMNEDNTDTVFRS